MLNTLIPNLSILIITVRRNLFAAVMTTLMLLLIIMAWSARGNVSTFLSRNPSPEQQTERITRGLASDEKINEVLKKNLSELNADRVLVRQFNNQVDPSTHTVIPSMTITYFVIAPGVGMDTSKLTIPRAYLSDLIQAVWQTGRPAQCAKLTRDDIKDTMFNTYLQKMGTVLFYSCPIVDLRGAPIGLVHAAYLTDNKKRPTDLVIQQQLSNTATRIAGYIDDVTAPEKEAWYRKLLDS